MADLKGIAVLFLFSLLVVLISAEEGVVSKEEVKAIQEKMDKFQLIETLTKLILHPELATQDNAEEREEKCLRVGQVCSFGSGPNCCGIRTRCFIWDELRSWRTNQGLKQEWISHCKEYNLGKWMDAIGSFFGNLG